MSNFKLFLWVLVCVLAAAYVVMDYLAQVRERTKVFEIFDDVEARKFMRECDGDVRVQVVEQRHEMQCLKKGERR